MSSLQLKGFSAVTQRLKDISSQMKSNAYQSALEMAEIIAEKAREYCPEGTETRADQDKLIDTIRVVERESGIEQGRNDIGQFTSGATITFAIIGGNERTPHFLAVHEHPSRYSPPSWDGVTVHFRKGGPKFIERSLNEEAGSVIDKLGRKVIR